MKKLLTLLTLLTIALSTFAQTFTVGDLEYSILSTDDKTVKVSDGSNATGDVVVPETVTYNDVEYIVTEIGNNAFYQNANITSVSLPSVKKINEYAFYGCTNINSLRISSIAQWCSVSMDGDGANPLSQTSQKVNIYIGNSETPATSIETPNTVTGLPNQAFRNTTITSISGSSVTTIGNEAFENCTSLISITFPSAVTIGSYAFKGCNTLAFADIAATTSISYGAFYDCSSLTFINSPYAASIGGYAFFGCSSLSSANIPAATSVDFGAFLNCTSLTSANFPVATSIGDHAFQGCTSLVSANIPIATSVGGFAFNDCHKLSSLDLPEVTEIGEWAFGNNNSLKYLAIPKVEKIGNYAFVNNTQVENLRVGSIEQYCKIEFGDATADERGYIQSFPFNDYYYHYGYRKNRIFVGNSDTPVTEITIPESIQQIPEYAFLDTDIHTIHFAGNIPPALKQTNSFPEWTMLAVPSNAYETYIAADLYNTIPLQITKEECLTYTIEIEAENGKSKLLEQIGNDPIRHVVNLKIIGSINSYDMLIIRNQMPSLRNLDLSDATIVDCDYIYSTTAGGNYHSVKDEISGDWLISVMNVKLPSTIKVIGNGAFNQNHNLVSVNIPDGVTSIGDLAFGGCWRIGELRLPQSVTSFGVQAFAVCTGLTEVVIPAGVTSIGEQAFYGCSDLQKVTIPASVTHIGRNAFWNIGSDRPVSLHISDLNSWLAVEMDMDHDYGNPIFSHVDELYIGDSTVPVEDIVIPDGIQIVKRNIFTGFIGIKSVKLPDELISIEQGAFMGCKGLTEILFSKHLKYIEHSAFQDCSSLNKIELPPHLESIGACAFWGCNNLTEVLISASLKQIEEFAFLFCDKIDRVIATTVEPIAIEQNTFSTFKTANLFIPKTSLEKYFWNPQYNQFLNIKDYDEEFAKTFGYEYFYLNGVNGDNKEDFEISDNTGVINGVGDDNPDADFNEGAGVIVGGSQVQELGDIHIHHNGNNGASVITKQSGKVHIDNLYVDIKVQKNRWYFFCFPFNINPGQATFDGSHVWYLYDGEARALNGNGGWKKVATDGVMQAGNGYIFQSAVNGTLTIHVQDVTIDGTDNSTNMITYESGNKNDASWNLIGNSNFAYYDIDNLGYEAPVTVYDNETGNYEAVRPGDDQYEFYPFQAFFVQKPADKETMDFDASKKETKNMADKSSAAKADTKAKSKAKGNSPRKVINLELASVDTDEKATDRTRIVVNPMKTTGYETDCDAAKFIADNMPQIYSKGNDGCIYSINERPVENGIIDLVVKITKEGAYSISAPRLDCAAKLRDLETGMDIDLTEGAYTFIAEANTYGNRFKLILANGTTGITTPEEAQAAISVEAGVININDTDADVKVYSVGGSLIKAQKGAGSISVPAGTYVVTVNGQSVKVSVKE